MRSPRKLYLPYQSFEQMELEFFCKPGTDLSGLHTWKKFCIGLAFRPWHQAGGERARDHLPRNCVFYSKATSRPWVLHSLWLGWAVGYCRQNWIMTDPASECIRTGYDITFDDESKENTFLCNRAFTGCRPCYTGNLCAGDEKRSEGDENCSSFPSGAGSCKDWCSALSKKLTRALRRYFQSFQKYYNCEFDRGTLKALPQKKTGWDRYSSSVKHMILILRTIRQLMSATATPWSRYA